MINRFLPALISLPICVSGTVIAAQEASDAGPDIGTAPPILSTPDETPIGEAAPLPPADAPSSIAPSDVEGPTTSGILDAAQEAQRFLQDGGPAIWAIAALSVITVTLILWKIWRLALIGAWSKGRAGQAVAAFENGDAEQARAIVRGRLGVRSKVVDATVSAVAQLPEDKARETAARIAKNELAGAGTGLRALELIATIAPLLGLLGTVLGMIAAFQALQEAGNRADPALLAGGIWEALLTTAAGMAVAIPASAALTWFEAVIDRIRRDLEDGITRIFVAHSPATLKLAAE
ncbi:MotA/TolQ/ExbB proton channel family protein [Roseobacter sp.]|uniref:MotA/TolQ/ExbB proton channel family protein n=1 Tax=Roseobacter sp. TaxID=1907202 RepID=UPI002965E180|nr:MotA/TolQ/ExbB proton channel family protein [Roseobacter sp.]MDW3183782.1 MotA/TolQ/ExbB proton channel family protein [Roseobacter sp.]